MGDLSGQIYSASYAQLNVTAGVTYYFLSSKLATDEMDDTQQILLRNIGGKLTALQTECPFVHVEQLTSLVRMPDENIEKYIRRLCEPIYQPNNKPL